MIAWERLLVEHAQSFGGLAFGVVEVADTVFAHQPRRLLGDAKPVALHTVVCVDAMVLASCHAPALQLQRPGQDYRKIRKCR
ncbi:hypothetical protein GCM10007862_28140 [Dyella lipolytica]|nr:hypothetical protein GCM10007862_28140 [Dyella lipolytica]